jgi:hypothetical protein
MTINWQLPILGLLGALLAGFSFFAFNDDAEFCNRAFFGKGWDDAERLFHGVQNTYLGCIYDAIDNAVDRSN